MSGFFAVRPDRLDLDRLHPKGFKILLEILARSRRLRVREHPFAFGVRHSGDSKATWREGALFVRRLIGLRLATLLGGRRIATISAFLAVGLSGIAVNNAALWFLAHPLNTGLLLAALLATQVSTTWNFILSDRLVFRGPKARSGVVRYLGFAGINNAALLARLPLLYLLVHHTALGDLAANTLTLALVFVVRFAVSDLVLFVRGDGMTATAERTNASEPNDLDGTGHGLPEKRRFGPVDLVIDLRQDRGPDTRLRGATTIWRYDVHGIVRIDSAVRLPELEWFRTSDLAVPDIVIRTGQLADSQIRRRARVTQYALFPGVSYQEQLGRFGSDFFVEMTDNIQVVVGPMLARSPHVLYTNVVEALLRFVLVSRGFMLLHSACLELDGRGVLLSALTDTGKTGTILRLLRENPSRFLSDDMTILDGTGAARCYPKPLTISQHTLRAVQAGDLSRKEWRRLRVQSRVHSKQGRGVGTRLGELNLPIMTLNAVTQLIVPPPKYEVDRLVPCEHTTSTSVAEMFVIERGGFALSDIDPADLFDELIANTDDAYGFPPFRYFAPALVVGGAAYEELRAEERRILVSAMGGVRARRLATPDFTWADHIPRLAADGRDSGEFRPSGAIPQTEPG